jgi:hypothetical protein
MGMAPGFVVWDENQTTMQIDDWKKDFILTKNKLNDIFICHGQNYHNHND